MRNLDFSTLIVIASCVYAGYTKEHLVIGLLAAALFIVRHFYNQSRCTKVEQYIQENKIKEICVITLSESYTSDDKMDIKFKTPDYPGEMELHMKYSLAEYNQLKNYRGMKTGIGTMQDAVYNETTGNIIGYNTTAQELIGWREFNGQRSRVISVVIWVTLLVLSMIMFFA